MKDRPRSHDSPGLAQALVAGLYAWLVSVSFGLAWLDIQYARLLPPAHEAFSEVADFLLFFTYMIGIAGVAALGLTWNSRATRCLLATSLLTAIALPFVLLVVLSAQAQDGSETGSVIRLLICGVASALALAGFYTIRRGG